MGTLWKLRAEKDTRCPCAQPGVLASSGRTDGEWEGLSTPHLVTSCRMFASCPEDLGLCWLGDFGPRVHGSSRGHRDRPTELEAEPPPAPCAQQARTAAPLAGVTGLVTKEERGCRDTEQTGRVQWSMRMSLQRPQEGWAVLREGGFGARHQQGP